MFCDQPEYFRCGKMAEVRSVAPADQGDVCVTDPLHPAFPGDGRQRREFEHADRRPAQSAQTGLIERALGGRLEHRLGTADGMSPLRRRTKRERHSPSGFPSNPMSAA